MQDNIHTYERLDYQRDLWYTTGTSDWSESGAAQADNCGIRFIDHIGTLGPGQTAQMPAPTLNRLDFLACRVEFSYPQSSAR